MILHIAARSTYSVGSRVHLNALRDIYGPDNVIAIDLRLDIQPCKSEYYIAYGKRKKITESAKCWLQGNNKLMSNDIIKDIVRLIKEMDIRMVFTEESFFGSLMREIKKQCPDVKIICFYHDVGADLFRQWRRHSKGIRKVESQINIWQEKMNVDYCDMNIVYHKYDAERFRKYYHKNPNAIIPLSAYECIEDNGINQFHSISKSDSSKKITFVCSSYYPNIVGIRWFYDNVLPKLSKKLRVEVVGRRIDFLRDEFKNPQLTVVGFVESLDEVYRETDIIIAPIFDGGGMKVKCMEAVAYGKCIVGTSESMRGLWEEMDGIQDKIVFQSDTAEGWIEILNKLAESDIYKCNAELHQIFLEKFSYQAFLRNFKEVLDYNGGLR